MPDLFHTLLAYDIGHLRIIAELWGLELESTDSDSAALELSASLLDPQTVRDTVDILHAQSQSAIAALVESDGKMEWDIFARRFGDIREMGAGKRDREKPHRAPISTTENLFYRGLIAKAFFDTDKGAREFAYIPDDLHQILRDDLKDGGNKKMKDGEPLGRLATSAEKKFEIPAPDRVLDDATTYLAALRMGRTDFPSDARLTNLLISAKLISKKNVLQTDAVKKFLGISRADALQMFYDAWQSSSTFDELRLIPNLICEGEWTNDPYSTRHTVLNFINAIPKDKWWNLPAFLRDIKSNHPNFQRPAGDYDSWFIKRASDGQYLRGFASWDAVDGALIKYIIQILHWLGEVDLAAPEEGKECTAFRVKSKVESQKPSDFRPSTFNEKITVASNGKIIVSRYFPRAVRYQVARFCEWMDEKPDEYPYRITARALKSANKQGLKAEQLLSLLVKYTKGKVPPSLVKALKRWEVNGAEARVETQVILRVNKPEVLKEMRNSSAGKFLGEAISPTAVVVKSGAVQKVIGALAELGLLAEFMDDNNE